MPTAGCLIRLMALLPSQKRIVQDIKRVISAEETIAEHRGAFMSDSAGGREAGHRHIQTTAKTSKNHEGKREKKEWGDNFLMHKGLRSLLDEPEQDVTGQFAVQGAPNDLNQEEYANVKISYIFVCFKHCPPAG